MSLLDRDHYPENFMERIDALQRDLRDLARAVRTGRGTFVTISTVDVSSPPTDAELDTVFGTPTEVGGGWMVLLNDNGEGSAEYLVWSDGASWWYVAGTKAS